MYLHFYQGDTRCDKQRCYLNEFYNLKVCTTYED